MIQYRDLINNIRSLRLSPDRPLLAHVSPQAAEKIQGGEGSLLGALRETIPILLMPSFTYQTMVFPKTGPKDNGVEYNNPPVDNQEAVFFDSQLPVSPQLGKTAEMFRQLPETTRSIHPILSFCGLNADPILRAQSIVKPYGPIEELSKHQGWILFLDEGQEANFSIHYGLKKGGRKLFTRWALTSAGVKTCPHYPGCSAGFFKLSSRLQRHTRHNVMDTMSIQAFPVEAVLHEVKAALEENPLALLCDKDHCLRCESVRVRN